MPETKYKPSIKLLNELETDHYETAREVFERSRGSRAALKQSIQLFNNYDSIKADVIESMVDRKAEEAYTNHVRGFTSARAKEIIEAAFKDHHDEATENGETVKSNTWRRA